jgi:hypothetical protein
MTDQAHAHHDRQTSVSTSDLRDRVGSLMRQAHDDLAALVACKSVAE